jgi:hypothetical protein
MKQVYIISGVLFVAVLLLYWWFRQGNQTVVVPTASHSTAQSPSPIQSSSSSTTNTASAAASSPQKVVTVPTPASWVNKAIAMKEIWAGANGRSQDFYGKAIDQHGNPVEDATAIGTLMQIQGIDTGTKKETLTAKTDASGNFEFTGHHGWQLGVVVKKEGYQVGQGVGVYEAPNKEDVTSPTERAIFHMWRLQGSEPMTSARISSYLPLDGSSINFNLLTGAQTASGGDITITYKRNTPNASGGKPFDWSITFQMPNGGLLEQSDAYPNEAPSERYSSSVTVNVPATTPQWSASLSRSFYFKCRGGQDYGRMNVRVTLGGGRPPHPEALDALVYTNPNGSRNLEYDSNLRAQAQ